MKLSKTRAKIVEEFVDGYPFGFLGDGRRKIVKIRKEAIRKKLTQALNDYTQSIIEMVDKQKHSGNCKELGCKFTYNQALDDIKEELQG